MAGSVEIELKIDSLSPIRRFYLGILSGLIKAALESYSARTGDVVTGVKIAADASGESVEYSVDVRSAQDAG